MVLVLPLEVSSSILHPNFFSLFRGELAKPLLPSPSETGAGVDRRKHLKMNLVKVGTYRLCTVEDGKTARLQGVLRSGI